jgi:hypothetical protein
MTMQGRTDGLDLYPDYLRARAVDSSCVATDIGGAEQHMVAL